MNCHICNSPNVSKYCSKDDHVLYKCGNCQHIFVSSLPNDLDEIYKEDYFHGTEKQKTGYTNYDEDKASMRHTFELYLKKFAKLVQGRNILDIGCATGYFLNLAKSGGWNTYGVEISEYAGNMAEEKGHRVYIGDLPRFQIDQKMDVITMWDVLEHVDDPKKYLESANNLLNNGGYLAINTPDSGSLWAKIMGKNWHLIVPPEHLNYFNKESLKIILEQTGFDVIEIKNLGKKFSLPYFFNMGYRWQGFKLWKVLANFFDKPFWRKFGIPINLRDNIFVLAKKIND